MPLYEYYCADCRTKFELLSPFSRADKDVVCQQCHSTKVRRLLSVFAAHRGGDGEFGDGYHFSGPDDGCACGGNCECGGLEN